MHSANISKLAKAMPQINQTLHSILMLNFSSCNSLQQTSWWMGDRGIGSYLLTAIKTLAIQTRTLWGIKGLFLSNKLVSTTVAPILDLLICLLFSAWGFEWTNVELMWKILPWISEPSSLRLMPWSARYGSYAVGSLHISFLALSKNGYTTNSL